MFVCALEPNEKAPMHSHRDLLIGVFLLEA